MFDILMYLFENYIHSKTEVYIEHSELTKELQRAGFSGDEIFKALEWLEQLADLQYVDEFPYLNCKPNNSTRVFTVKEQQILDVECQGFLMFLEQISVIDSITREMVIDRIMALEKNYVSLDDLKWVVLMVLFNVPGKESAYATMEELLFEECDGTVH